jgi:hypothetical protein
MSSYFGYEKSGTVGHIIIRDNEGRDTVATYGWEYALHLYERVVAHFTSTPREADSARIAELESQLAAVAQERDDYALAANVEASERRHAHAEAADLKGRLERILASRAKGGT